jgi:hypothetical protein
LALTRPIYNLRCFPVPAGDYTLEVIAAGILLLRLPGSDRLASSATPDA